MHPPPPPQGPGEACKLSGLAVPPLPTQPLSRPARRAPPHSAQPRKGARPAQGGLEAGLPAFTLPARPSIGLRALPAGLMYIKPCHAGRFEDVFRRCARVMADPPILQLLYELLFYGHHTSVRADTMLRSEIFFFCIFCGL